MRRVPGLGLGAARFGWRLPLSLGLARSARPRLGLGTRLIREWRGEVHQVTVGEDGFDYRGMRYGSLSQIARQITGTRWSGPLFFGLRKAAQHEASTHDR